MGGVLASRQDTSRSHRVKMTVSAAYRFHILFRLFLLSNVQKSYLLLSSDHLCQHLFWWLFKFLWESTGACCWGSCSGCRSREFENQGSSCLCTRSVQAALLYLCLRACPEKHGRGCLVCIVRYQHHRYLFL